MASPAQVARLIPLLLLGCLARPVAAAPVGVLCNENNRGRFIVDAINTKATVVCPPGCLKSTDTVWGSGVYLDDSSICRAAIHAGVLTNKGGRFTLYYERGQVLYRGTTANGVKSEPYGSYDGSIKFKGPARAAVATCNTHNANKEVVSPQRPFLKVTCPAFCLTEPGSVWGTGIYLGDSNLCLAAIHAGVIKPSGGVVPVYYESGIPVYRATRANGVSSIEYGPWDHSYRFTPKIRLTCNSTNAGAAAIVTATKPTTTVVCPAGCAAAINAGPVYGSQVYASNSRICRAAIHAGVIPKVGGTFYLRHEAGKASYPGNTANGVTSVKSGAWTSSFRPL